MNDYNVLYRIEPGYYDEYSSKVTLFCREYIILRNTPQGYWISRYGKDKWVSNNARKRFAYPTREEAMVNFQKRKERYLKILNRQVASTIRILSDIKENKIKVIDGKLS